MSQGFSAKIRASKKGTCSCPQAKSFSAIVTVQRSRLAIFFDEDSRRWRIVSKGEPKFKRDFPTQKEAFDVWHVNFHPGTGKLRKVLNL
jgi:hypothetical protein